MFDKLKRVFRSAREAPCPIVTPPACPKVFIASSWQALPLARELKERLDKGDRVADVVLWEQAFPVGGIILNTLREEAAKVDFAAVLFTSDDHVLDGKKGALAPRDNCVFELGLFMGALGLDPRRALLLRTKDSTLLSDLGGMVYADLPSKHDGKDVRNQLLDRAVEQIKSSVKELQYCFNHPPVPDPKIIPIERLLDLEKRGLNLVKGDAVDVLINTTQPIELDHDLAGRVCENMSSDVGYNYFFEADIRSVKFFSSLVSTLAAAPIVAPAGSMNMERWRDVMSENQARVDTVLDTLRNRLRIYLLPKKPDLEFCVHNASHENEAICYLRHSSHHFVEWFRGESARYVADTLRDKCFSPPQNMVFQGTEGYDLYSHSQEDFRQELIASTLDRFPEGLGEKVRDVCFGN